MPHRPARHSADPRDDVIATLTAELRHLRTEVKTLNGRPVYDSSFEWRQGPYRPVWGPARDPIESDAYCPDRRAPRPDPF